MFGGPSRYRLLDVHTAILLTMLVAAVRSEGACYFPDGSPSPGDVRCVDGDASACCGPKDICLSNGLCMGINQPFVLARGTCSDSTWQSSKCPDRCADVNPGAGCSIVLLSASASSKEYCCNAIIADTDSGKAVCSNGDPFLVPDGEVIAGKGALAGYELVANSSSSAVATSSTAAATAPTPTAQTTTSATVSSPTSPSGCSSADTNNNNNNGTTPSGVGTTSSSHDVVIGAGVGVPLGVIAIAALLWALYERRKRKALLYHGPGGWDYTPQTPSTYRPQQHKEAAATIPTQYTGRSSMANTYYSPTAPPNELDDPNRHATAVELDTR